MDNHLHLLVATPNANLARGMRQLNGVYAQRFNGRHGRFGHLFGGRYKAILVQREPHLLELCRYIVLNPARSESAPRSYETFPWSSYRATAGLVPVPAFLRPTAVLRHFDGDLAEARRRYREFVRAGLGGAQVPEEVVGEVYLGDRDFVRGHTAPNACVEIPRAQREPVRCSLASLFEHDLQGAVARAYREHGYSLREIAAVLGVHYSTVSRRLRREEARSAGVALQDLTPNGDVRPRRERGKLTSV